MTTHTTKYWVTFSAKALSRANRLNIGRKAGRGGPKEPMGRRGKILQNNIRTAFHHFLKDGGRGAIKLPPDEILDAENTINVYVNIDTDDLELAARRGVGGSLLRHAIRTAFDQHMDRLERDGADGGRNGRAS